MNRFFFRSTILATFALSNVASAQSGRMTAAEYDRAVNFLGPNLTGLVIGGSVSASWLPDGRFWYRSQTQAGSEFRLVSPAAKRMAPAFDHQKLASALSSVSGSAASATQLPFQSITFSTRMDSVSFNVGQRQFRCDVGGNGCVAAGTATDAGGRGGRGGRAGGGGGGRGNAGPTLAMSPDGRSAAFVRDWNLWIRDVATGRERQLTTDGVTNFGYATDNAGWRTGDRPMILWSPDSKKIATQQQDERNVGEMHMLTTAVGRPTLRSWKYPLPGDTVVAMIHRVVIEVESGRIVRLQMSPDYHRATLGDDISMNDYNWSPDGSQLALVSTGRDHKDAVLKVADASTGAVRTVMTETVATHYESRTGWRVLWATNEVLWYSQRDDWGQLYLYDLNTGALKNQVTTGQGPVTDIARLDEKTRTLWYGANGREPGQDPYFRHYYRVGLDGKNAVSLTPDDGMHDMQLSPDGKYLVDSYSKPDVPPTVARPRRRRETRYATRAGGRLAARRRRLEAADTDQGQGSRRQDRPVRADVPPDELRLRRRSTRSSTTRIPVHRAAAPGAVPSPPARGDRQALAELGFVVVTIDGRGTPGRSKSFHDAYYGAMGRDNTIPDQVAGMKDLASSIRGSTSTRRRCGATRAAASSPPTRCSASRTSSRSASPNRAITTSASTRTTGASAIRVCSMRNPDGTDNYDVEANQIHGEEPQGPAAARARHDGQQRAAVQHAARGGRADQGEQGLRSADDAERSRTATATRRTT